MVDPNNPGAGEPKGIGALATVRSIKASELRSVHDAVASAKGTVSGSAWTGKAQVAFVSAMDAVTPDLTLLASGLEAVAAALDVYAGQVGQIKDRQATLELKRRSAQKSLDSNQLKLVLSRDLDENVLFQERIAGTNERTASIQDLRARLSESISSDKSRLAQVDAEWSELITWRRYADATCVSALCGEKVLGKTAPFAGGAIRSIVPRQLLDMLAGLSASDLAALFKAHPDLADKIAQAGPETIAEWWTSIGSGMYDTLSDAQQALIAGIPAIIGALNGLPPMARVAANRISAKAGLAQAEKRLATLEQIENTVKARTGRIDKSSRDETNRLKREVSYLKKAADGRVKLYLYDATKSRIVEMIGTPSPSTRHVITYVPGTFTSISDFHSGAVQQVGTYLVDSRNDTVMFAYKDGKFPGGDDQTAKVDLVRILEANDQSGATAAGKTLAGFQTGLDQDPYLSKSQSVAVGHSWGLTNVTASEMSGAHYDQVVSLSGAWMPEGWHPASDTRYSDFSYDDILQALQREGFVGKGNFPRNNSAFDHDDYYRAPGDVFLYASGADAPHQSNPQNFVSDHNLIASDNPDNELALKNIKRRVFKK